MCVNIQLKSSSKKKIKKLKRKKLNSQIVRYHQHKESDTMMTTFKNNFLFRFSCKLNVPI